MAKIKALLYKSKQLSNGEYPVMIWISHDYYLKHIATGYSTGIRD